MKGSLQFHDDLVEELWLTANLAAQANWPSADHILHARAIYAALHAVTLRAYAACHHAQPLDIVVRRWPEGPKL